MLELDVSKLNELRNEYGEAFYLLDSVQFRSNFKELKDVFSSIYKNFNIAYSYKTNYIPKLCKIVNELNGYAEVVSEMEVELARKVGVETNRIIWNGPIKKPEIMEQFLCDGGSVNIDSLEEAESIKEIAKRHLETVFNIGIRCNYDVNDDVISRFGFDIDSDDFKRVMDFVQNTKNIHLINLQCHFAKRQIEYWPDRSKGMIDLLDRIGIIPERIDLGGGIFGKMDESLKKQFTFHVPRYREYAEVAATIFAERFPDAGPELLIEPGSALVGDCMKFVGTVKTIKNVRGKTIISVLGSQKNISMTGINPPIEVYSMGDDKEEVENADLTGFTCIESDVLYRNYTGKIAVNDAIVINNCGSYSLVMKPPFILPNFPVLDISEGETEVIKRAENFNDIFHTFIF